MKTFKEFLSEGRISGSSRRGYHISGMRYNKLTPEGNLPEDKPKHVVTHSPSTYEYYSHEAKQDPKPEGIFKYTDAEDRDEAKEKAEKHAAEMNK